MSDVVLKVENLGKQYRLGMVGTGALTDDLNRWWHRIRGKEDPYLKVGDVNDRETRGDSKYVWALRDINFEVKRGEVLGIVGKNGAGKSTLLKLLSRVTGPTSGEIKIKGRTASLLEVGTGFHLELSGRENIYLNGAILGMTKAEIDSKYDEIVEFSGVERYIDTPVKRYSSGMTVRLAFAVAAHLEPEILIVDEVLAVGDFDFQQKCLGKMKEVSGQGRTVLFVSHNLSAVRDLCTRAILIEKGELKFEGSTMDVIDQYLKGDSDMSKTGIVPPNFIRQEGTLEARITAVQLRNEQDEFSTELFFREKFRIVIELEAEQDVEGLMASVRVGSPDGYIHAFSDSYSGTNKTYNYNKGKHTVELEVDSVIVPGSYALYVGLAFAPSGLTVDYIERIFDFQVLTNSRLAEQHYKWASSKGSVMLSGEWKM